MCYVLIYVVARLACLARQWIKRTRNELFERYVLGVICGGSFGSFDSPVDKKNEK